jgi:hypothetical protein
MRAVILAAVLTWTHPTADLTVDHFRVYAARVANTSIRESLLIASVDSLEWEVDLPPGRWYVKVTHWNHEDDRESGASREMSFMITNDGEVLDEDTHAPRELTLRSK